MWDTPVIEKTWKDIQGKAGLAQSSFANRAHFFNLSIVFRFAAAGGEKK